MDSVRENGQDGIFTYLFRTSALFTAGITVPAAGGSPVVVADGGARRRGQGQARGHTGRCAVHGAGVHQGGDMWRLLGGWLTRRGPRGAWGARWTGVVTHGAFWLADPRCCGLVPRDECPAGGTGGGRGAHVGRSGALTRSSRAWASTCRHPRLATRRTADGGIRRSLFCGQCGRLWGFRTRSDRNRPTRFRRPKPGTPWSFWICLVSLFKSLPSFFWFFPSSSC